VVLSKSENKAEAVTQRLRQLVSTREVGAKIPSERDLSDEWGIARMTARKAIEILADEGLLDRRRGSGTYVAQKPYARTAGLSSFTADMLERGLTPTSEVLDFERVRADSSTSARLDIAEGDAVVRFTRLRLADGEPIAAETSWIPAHLVPGMTEEDLSGSLFETLIDKFKIIPGQASSTIDSTMADDSVAVALGIGDREPCLRIQMDYLDSRRRSIMAATCLYRGDKYQLHVVLAASAFTAESLIPRFA
jgi:GntR family transcriptional regulator